MSRASKRERNPRDNRVSERKRVEGPFSRGRSRTAVLLFCTLEEVRRDVQVQRLKCFQAVGTHTQAVRLTAWRHPYGIGLISRFPPKAVVEAFHLALSLCHDSRMPAPAETPFPLESYKRNCGLAGFCRILRFGLRIVLLPARSLPSICHDVLFCGIRNFGKESQFLNTYTLPKYFIIRKRTAPS